MKFQHNLNRASTHNQQVVRSMLSGQIIALLLLIQLVLFPMSANAQAEVTPKFFSISHVDESQSPMVSLWLYGDGLGEALANANVEIIENEKSQSIIGDTIEQTDIKLIVAIDPWQLNELDAAGLNGQSRVAAILRSLVDKTEADQVLVRLQDQIAAHSILPNGHLQIIQEWTNEPNLLYNSVVLTQTESTTQHDQLTALLMQSMQEFATINTQPVDHSVKTLLLFANAASAVDVRPVVAQATAQGIHIHVINLSGEAVPAPALQQLAQQTQGHYANFTPDTEPSIIWQSLAEYHSQRHIAYFSSTNASRKLVVSFQAQGQPVLSQTFESSNNTTSNDIVSNDSKQPIGDSANTNNPEPAAEGVTKGIAAPTLEPKRDAIPVVATAIPATALPVAASAGSAPTSQTENETVASAELPISAAPPLSTVAPDQTQDDTGADVTIPGTTLQVPRAALIAALPILLLLLSYLIYRETRDRRANRPGEYQLSPQNKVGKKTNATNEIFKRAKNNSTNLAENSVPLRPLAEEREAQRANKRTDPDQQAEKAHDLYHRNGFAEHDFRNAATLPKRSSAIGNRPLEKPTTTQQQTVHNEIDDDDDDDDGDNGDDLATMVSLNFSDDEATFRLRDSIEQPIIGKLVRVSNNPNLPQQLPIYGLNPGLGQSRQIHIGRHSKNNTVVINDKAISREHAVLIQKEGRIYLRDNASSAGTYLNGRRLQPGEELLLRHNDLIGFGEITYGFQAKGEDEATLSNP